MKTFNNERCYYLDTFNLWECLIRQKKDNNRCIYSGDNNLYYIYYKPPNTLSKPSQRYDWRAAFF